VVSTMQRLTRKSMAMLSIFHASPARGNTPIHPGGPASTRIQVFSR
jgi:hypothetical protein